MEKELDLHSHPTIAHTFSPCDTGSRTASYVAYRLRMQVVILQRLEETQQQDLTPASTRAGSVDD